MSRQGHCAGIGTTLVSHPNRRDYAGFLAGLELTFGVSNAFLDRRKLTTFFIGALAFHRRRGADGSWRNRRFPARGTLSLNSLPRIPLGVVGEGFQLARAVQPEHYRRDTI